MGGIHQFVVVLWSLATEVSKSCCVSSPQCSSCGCSSCSVLPCAAFSGLVLGRGNDLRWDLTVDMGCAVSITNSL